MRSVEIRILGTASLQRNLARKQMRAADMSPVLRVLARDFRTIMRKQFDSEGRYLGRGWAPLSGATREDKGKRGLDSRILHRTRRLRKSLTIGTEGIRYVGPHELELGSEVEYAGVIHEGTSKMPARPLFKFDAMTKTRWRRSMAAYLNRGVLQVGGP